MVKQDTCNVQFTVRFCDSAPLLRVISAITNLGLQNLETLVQIQQYDQFILGREVIRLFYHPVMYRGLAQLVERLLWEQEAVGSSPAPSTKIFRNEQQYNNCAEQYNGSTSSVKRRKKWLDSIFCIMFYMFLVYLCQYGEIGKHACLRNKFFFGSNPNTSTKIVLTANNIITSSLIDYF